MKSLLFPRLAVALFAGLVLSGCGTVDKSPKYPSGAGFVPTNVYRPFPSLALHRVALLPAYVPTDNPGRQQDVDAAFSAEASRTGRFEVVTISRNELNAICGRSQISSVEGLLPRLMPALRSEYGADAMLLVDITRDEPYRPIAMGVRAKLIDLRGGTPILWSCDVTFDSGNPAVSNSAKRFQLDEGRQDFPLDQDGSSILISPARFAHYAANAVFATLPR